MGIERGLKIQPNPSFHALCLRFHIFGIGDLNSVILQCNFLPLLNSAQIHPLYEAARSTAQLSLEGCVSLC